MSDETPRLLIDAVDDLTTPNVLTRFAGRDHSHDWMELVRPSTREERLAAKKEKPPRKLGGMVKTGEWWCPWCELVVAERPDDEPALTIDRFDDAPLLDQLEQRIRSTLGDAGTRGANTGGSPIDIAAYSLHGRIRVHVRGWLRAMGARPGKDLTLTQLMRSWYTLRAAGLNPVGEDEKLRKQLDGWRTAIMDILDPPTQVPYRGQACPICGEKRAQKEVEGVVDDSVALWAVLRPAYRSEGSYGICRACDTILAKDPDPILLRQKMNGTVSTGKIGFVYQSESFEPF